MTTIYIARYADHMYPEDNENFGAYLTWYEANKRNKLEQSYWTRSARHCDMHKASENYYYIDEITLFDEKEIE